MHLRAGLALTLLLITLGIAAGAHAQPGAQPAPPPAPPPTATTETQARLPEPTLQQFAVGTFNRARRAVAIGPLVGIGASYALTPEQTEVPISFGFGVALFKVAVVPTPEMIKDMVLSRVKSKVADKVAGMVARGEPAPDQQELERIGREIYEEVRAEILGLHRVRGKTIERPRGTFALEGTYLPRAGAGLTRATLGIGISKVTIGPTIVANFAGPNGLFVGGELAVHLTPRHGPRAPVIDVYLRYDYGVTKGSKDTDQIGLGLRYMLDII